MRSWEHSGFSVDNSDYLSPSDTFGLERLAQYILRCPFSLARVVRLTEDGSVIYRAEKDHCRRFPGPASGDLRGGPHRNFQVFSALDFLAELTQHIPEKGEHLVRYYGWYSHRQRGIRVKRRQPEESEKESVGIDRSAAVVLIASPAATPTNATDGTILLCNGFENDTDMKQRSILIRSIDNETNFGVIEPPFALDRREDDMRDLVTMWSSAVIHAQRY